MRFRSTGLLIAAALLASPLFAHAAGDAAKGKTVFAKCMACHAVVAGKNGVGPSLFGVVGRASGTVPGYTYSEDLKKLNLTWTPENIDKWVTNPKAMAPKTKMTFPGLNNADDRANLIAYLDTLK